jgi:THO complex subunit 4
MRVAPIAHPRRTKKGPRRVKKTVMQLDKEIEDYRAASGAFGIKDDNS